MSKWVHVNVDEITAETEKAFLCLIGDEEIWIPVSQISEPNNYGVGDYNVTLSVTEWIAREKGLDG